jgi:hypothetical protein
MDEGSDRLQRRQRDGRWLVKLSRRAESMLAGTLRFFDEYRPVNRSHCGVCGSGDSGTFLLLTSANGYS